MIWINIDCSNTYTTTHVVATAAADDVNRNSPIITFWFQEVRIKVDEFTERNVFISI